MLCLGDIRISLLDNRAINKCNANNVSSVRSLCVKIFPFLRFVFETLSNASYRKRSNKETKKRRLTKQRRITPRTKDAVGKRVGGREHRSQIGQGGAHTVHAQLDRLSSLLFSISRRTPPAALSAIPWFLCALTIVSKHARERRKKSEERRERKAGASGLTREH